MLEPVVPYACTRPKLPRTGLQLPRCYARAMNDCSPVLSAEHYISRNVLEALGGTFASSVLPGGARAQGN